MTLLCIDESELGKCVNFVNYMQSLLHVNAYVGSTKVTISL